MTGKMGIQVFVEKNFDFVEAKLVNVINRFY